MIDVCFATKRFESLQNGEMDMAYVEGFLIPVSEDRKDEYFKIARDFWPIFKDLGVTRQVECWGDDLMRGEQTDFYRAVAAKEGENVVFSWMEYPDKATRDDTNKRMMEDERLAGMAEMPFDGKRMVFSGFVKEFDSAQEPE